MSSSVRQPSMGVLKLRESENNFQLKRYVPSGDIGFFVKHFWVVSWDLSGMNPYSQDVVPNPCVNWVVEHDKTAIYGIAKYKYSKLLQGKGRVFGAKFKPGAFYPFVNATVSSLTGSSIDVRTVFGADAQTMAHEILAQEEEEAMVELAERIIRPKLPERDENIEVINRMIDRIAEDREITKVDDICERAGVNKRKLQRLFDQYVGVNPKWVIKLYRLQNAAATIDNGEHHDWLQLSIDLGYYDQSHFIKDFKSIIGKTPDEYTRAKRS